MTIQDALRELGIDHREHGQHSNVRDGWIAIECPRCSSATGYLLGISLEDRGRAHCWQCGKVPLVEALSELSGRSFAEVRRLLGDPDGERPRREEKPQGRLKLPSGLGPLLPAHRKYLRERGFADTGALERLWGLQGIGVHHRLPWRIWIPVTLEGKTVSWTTRAIGDAKARYVSASPEEEAVHHKDLLFGEDFARHGIVVCEGPFDAMRVGPGAVAVLGISITRSQVERMSRYPLRCICFDAEPSARKRAGELADLLEPFPGETVVVTLETGKDAAEASEREIRRLRREFLR